MRLICPNCGAQYEVPDEVIPESGRDVQCSNCGDTWFQHHPDHQPEEPQDADTDSSWTEDLAPEPEPEPEPANYADTSEPDHPYEGEYEDDYEDEAPPVPERRELDPSVADVLREEAAREEQARAASQRGGLETQQELGLEEQDGGAHTREEQARARMARLRGMPEDTAPDTADDSIDPSSRRNLLPDIDEINSSLSSESTADAAAPPAKASATADTAAPARGGGFRSGFRLVIVLAVLGLLLYVFAPRLSEVVPALSGPLEAYVGAVNAGRTALADFVNDLAGSISESENAGQ